MILVTGAAGKTGKAIISALASRGAVVRAFVHRREYTQDVFSLGAHEVVVGNMLDPHAFNHAVLGCRAVYHICPNVDPNEFAIGNIAIEAAAAAGIEHFVYHSVLHPHIEAMPHHWQKMRVEELLFNAHLPFTILQPTAYMQNITAQWQSISETGIYTVPYPLETQTALVALEDVAAAAAIVLTQPGHLAATYELCGPDNLNQTEIAALISAHLSRPVRAERLPISLWVQRAKTSGMGSYQIETLVKMFRYYETSGLPGNPKALSHLLGHPPVSFTAFIQNQFPNT